LANDGHIGVDRDDSRYGVHVIYIEGFVI
jgi:hypothetical protein